MNSLVVDAPLPVQEEQERPLHQRIGARFSLVWEVVKGGFIELWAHKLRSMLTLTLLMLGVFALVVLTSVLDGVVDKVSTGFAGMAWDGTIKIAPKTPLTTEEAKRFAMSPGLRYEDLPRILVPDDRIFGFSPRAQRRSSVRVAGGAERVFIMGVTHEYATLNNRSVSLGRFLTEDDGKRHNRVAVVGSTLASKLFGGADPVGRDVVLEGVSFRIVGVQAPIQVFNEEMYLDSNGFLIPLATYMDRMDPDHKISQVAVKLRSKDLASDVSATLIARARQAHHGVEDIEAVDLDAESVKAYQGFMEEMRGWRVVLMSLAGTVLLVGGVGVLSVMLISFSDRRFEIGLRKAMGASDGEILIQFLLEALVLAALGALVGTLGGTALCRALSPMFPWGLVVNKGGLVTAWVVALSLAAVFGLYPALKASRLSPIEAMR